MEKINIGLNGFCWKGEKKPGCKQHNAVGGWNSVNRFLMVRIMDLGVCRVSGLLCLCAGKSGWLCSTPSEKWVVVAMEEIYVAHLGIFNSTGTGDYEEKGDGQRSSRKLESEQLSTVFFSTVPLWMPSFQVFM